MKILQKLKQRTKKGFTLTEILLVVGFIAIAGIGVYVVYNKVQTGNAANTEARNIDTIRAGVKNIYGATVNYTNLENKVLLDARVVPDNMRAGNAGTAIINSFGGSVTVAPVTFNAGSGNTNNAFTITYTNVPVDVCSKLISVAAPGFNKVAVGTGTGTVVKDTSSSTGNELNIATSTAACANSAGTGATIVFTSL